MIQVKLSENEVLELQSFRKQASSRDSEKALMILMNNEGKTVPEIAKTLKRHGHTVREWIKRFQKNGINGLARNYSPGRPSEKRDSAKEYMKEILGKSPEDYKYLDKVWTIPLLMHQLKKQLGKCISGKTISRALKDLGYSYKRPSKTTCKKTISQEKRREMFQIMLDEIKQLSLRKDCEIYAIDESHFLTEPYIVRGWFLKKRTTSNRNSKNKGSSHILWRLKSQEQEILLEKIS